LQSIHREPCVRTKVRHGGPVARFDVAFLHHIITEICVLFENSYSNARNFTATIIFGCLPVNSCRRLGDILHLHRPAGRAGHVLYIDLNDARVLAEFIAYLELVIAGVASEG
jgi:hypothetical protein